MRRLKKFLFLSLSLAFQTVWAQIPPGAEMNSPFEQPTGMTLQQKLATDATHMVLGERDPFRRPKYYDDLDDEAKQVTIAPDDKTINEKTEAIRRWPLRFYRPIAVIWDVKNPKVMVVDPSKTMHLLKKNYRMGNRNGMITAINEGEIVVTENGTPNVMKIESADGR